MNKVIKLGKQGCAPCASVEGYLQSKGVEYQDVDVFASPNIAAKYDISSVPVTILLDSEDDEIGRSIGFKPPELDKLISQL